MSPTKVPQHQATHSTCVGQVSTKDLPPADSATFTHSSFFLRNGPAAKLPSPAHVRQRGILQDPTSKNCNFAFRPVYYQELGLIVKFGKAPEVTVAEGQCLWALRRALPAVPVPEVYGWTHDDSQVFIYMELVPGETLEKQWSRLSATGRVDICKQLSAMVTELRKLRHAPGESFIGHINRKPVLDIMFTNVNRPGAGPFNSVVELHDWISWAMRYPSRHHWPGIEVSDIPDPYRSGLPDDAEVVFTHSDLHPSNIMVSKNTESPRIVAIIDWHQSGWYPDYWEFCKAAYTAEVHGEWRDVYIPMFLKEPGCVDTWDDYAMAFGY